MLLDTTVFLHAYVITYLLVTPSSRRFTLIGNHLTPCEIYLFNIRTHHCNMCYAYISIPGFCILVDHSTTTPEPKDHQSWFQFFPYKSGPSVTRQCVFGDIISCTAHKRINRREPPTSASSEFRTVT